MHWRISALAAGIVILAAVEAVLLTRKGDWERCTDKNPEVRILGCTAIIQAGRDKTANLSIALHNRGLAYTDTGEYDRAIEDFDLAIKINPNNASAFSGRGRGFAIKGQYDRAIEDYDQAIKLDPKESRVFQNRGIAYGRKGEHNRAIEDFDQAIKLKPDYAAAFAERGAAYNEKGQYDLAIEDFQRALALDPRNAAARNGFQLAGLSQQFEHPPNQTNPAVYLIERGNLYAQMGQTDHAIQDYDHAIKLDPRDIADVWRAAPFLGRGNLYAKTGRYDRAIQDYNEAIRLAPNDAVAFSARGAAFRALGKPAPADADFAEAKRLNEERANKIDRQTSVLDKLFPPLMILGLISPFAAIITAFVFYGLHYNRVEPERRVSAVAYAIVVIACGITSGFVGLGFGLERACSSPTSPNLCGLWGFFVTGPLSFLLAIFLVGLALSLVRPRQSSRET
jgi:tetratricopeptide (TPR) repeat protein